MNLKRKQRTLSGKLWQTYAGGYLKNQTNQPKNPWSPNKPQHGKGSSEGRKEKIKCGEDMYMG